MERFFITLNRYWKVIRNATLAFIDGQAFTYSASLAFYTIFSLPAILLIAIWVASTIFDQATVQEALIDQIDGLVGASSAKEIQQIIEAVAISEKNFWAKLLGIGTLVFSATTVFTSLQNSLNQVWKIRPKPRKGILKYIINRLLSLSMVVSLGFLLLVSLMADTVFTLFDDWLHYWLSDWGTLLVQIVGLIFSLLITSLLFGLIFKVLPDAIISWKNIRFGALITTFLFFIGKFLIGFYLGNSTVADAYGAASAIIITLVWVYYSGLIVLFGAQLTYSFSEVMGYQIKPYGHAVEIEVKEIQS